MREKRTIYLAYGSNLNISQMAYRCPNAKPWGATILPDWKLEFWGGCGSAREHHSKERLLCADCPMEHHGSRRKKA